MNKARRLAEALLSAEHDVIELDLPKRPAEEIQPLSQNRLRSREFFVHGRGTHSDRL